MFALACVLTIMLVAVFQFPSKELFIKRSEFYGSRVLSRRETVESEVKLIPTIFITNLELVFAPPMAFVRWTKC